MIAMKIRNAGLQVVEGIWARHARDESSVSVARVEVGNLNPSPVLLSSCSSAASSFLTLMQVAGLEISTPYTKKLTAS